MVNIKDQSLLCVTLTSGTVQEIAYNSDYVLDIQNCTEGAVKISYSEDFAEHGNIGEYISIPSEGGYNGLRLRSNTKTVYLKAESDGQVNITARF